MDIEKKCLCFKNGEKHELTWIRYVATLSELSSRCLSPRFKTIEKVEWKISLWTGFESGEHYLFGTLFRMMDGGPPEVHYSVGCKLFIGPEPSENFGLKMQPSAHKTFAEGSTMDFRLLPISKISNCVGSYLSTAPVKVILKIRLQRRSLGSLRLKSISVRTELVLWSSLKQYCFEDNLYYGKKKKSILEEKPERKNIQTNTIKNYACSGGTDTVPNPWHPTFYEVNIPNMLLKVQVLTLDVNGDIHASSEVCTLESGAERIIYRIPVIKKADVEKNKEILSRDGELNLLWSLTRAHSSGQVHVSRKLTYVSRYENKSCLRNDLKLLHQNHSKGAILKIRTGGEEFNIHKDIIAARSPVFNAMFSNNMTEKLSNVIDVDELDSLTLRNFLVYLYSGTFVKSVEWEDAAHLYVIAHKYYVKSLFRICSRILASCVSSENYEKLSLLAHLFDDNDLQSVLASFNSLNSNNSICSNGCEHQTMYSSLSS